MAVSRYFPLLLAFVLGAAGCGSVQSLGEPAPSGAVVRSDDFERPDGPPGPNWAWQGGGSGLPLFARGGSARWMPAW